MLKSPCGLPQTPFGSKPRPRKRIEGSNRKIDTTPLARRPMAVRTPPTQIKENPQSALVLSQPRKKSHPATEDAFVANVAKEEDFDMDGETDHPSPRPSSQTSDVCEQDSFARESLPMEPGSTDFPVPHAQPVKPENVWCSFLFFHVLTCYVTQRRRRLKRKRPQELVQVQPSETPNQPARKKRL